MPERPAAYREVMATARERLLGRRAELEQHRASVERLLAALTDSQEAEGTIATHIADAASDLMEAQATVGTLTEIDREVADIDEALARLERGTYGVCIDCGELIDPARLKALPTAVRCLRCQTHYEHRIQA
ncbi:MAG: TraR/DksA C4-type zinc finger protein [Sphaerobacter sp.]|nr:TraR/DksA C4-type zinc finger protein [Sphaerobacter sp.]